MIDIVQAGTFSSSLEFHPARLGKGRGDHLPCLERGATIFSWNAGMSSNCRSSLCGSFKPFAKLLGCPSCRIKERLIVRSSHNVKTIRQSVLKCLLRKRMAKVFSKKASPDSVFQLSVTTVEERGILESFFKLPQTERGIIRRLLEKCGPRQVGVIRLPIPFGPKKFKERRSFWFFCSFRVKFMRLTKQRWPRPPAMALRYACSRSNPA